MSLLTKLTTLTTKLSLVGSSLVNTKVGVVKTSLVTSVNTGIRGQRGFSAYERAVALGYPDDEATWLESLQGEPGADSEVPGPPGDVQGVLHAADVKTPPVDADEFSFLDSAAAWIVKKFTWAQMKVAMLADAVMTGTTTMRARALRADLVGPYTILNPTDSTTFPINRSESVFVGAANWTRFAEIVLPNAGSDGCRCDAAYQVSSSADQIALSPPIFSTFGIRTTAGALLSAANYWTGGIKPNTAYYWRVYTDVDGSGKVRMTIYMYNSTGTNAKRYDGSLSFVSAQSDAVIRVWPNGDVATTVDPAGSASEVTRQTGLGTIAAMDPRLYLAADGNLTDPSKMTTVTDASTAYTLTAEDHMVRRRFTAATPVTVTVPTGVVSNGFFFQGVQEGAGPVSIVAGAGMSQRCAGIAKTRALYAPINIEGWSSTVYNVTNDLAAF